MSLHKLMELNSLLYSQAERCSKEYIKIPWSPIYREYQIPPEKFILRDESNSYVPSQIFKVDHLDHSHDFLLISIKNLLATQENPSFDRLLHFVGSLRVEKGEKSIQNRRVPGLEIIWGSNGDARGVKMANGRLTIWYNLIPAPEDNENDWNWYSGSATSVLQGDRELLYSFEIPDHGTVELPHWMGHDPQKRCMQIDTIKVLDKEQNTWSTPFKLSFQNYKLIGYSVRELGMSFTIASDPFSYSKDARKRCQLFRILSLFKDTNYILEELFVRKVLVSSSKIKKDDYLEFKAHYFTFMDLSLHPVLLPDKNNLSFIMSSCIHPGAAYGFKSNVTLEKPVEHPTKDFPEWQEEQKKKTFSWGLSNCQFAKCFHWFSCLPQDNFQSLDLPKVIGMNND